MSSELISHRTVWKIERFQGLWLPEHELEGRVPDSKVAPGVSLFRGNVLTYGGASAIIQQLTTHGATGGTTTTKEWTAGHFGESDTTPWVGAYIGVGTSDTAATETDVDLGATGTANAYYRQMASGFPQYSDGDAISAGDAISTVTSDMATVSFKSSFATGHANFAWKEFCVCAIGTNPAAADANGTAGTSTTLTDTGGTFSNRMFNRKVSDNGTKTSADTWNLTVNITFA